MSSEMTSELALQYVMFGVVLLLSAAVAIYFVADLIVKIRGRK